MASDGSGDNRRRLKEATGKDVEDFIDPSTKLGFTDISGSERGVVLSSRRGDGTHRPFPHLTIPFDSSSGRAVIPITGIAPHYTEVMQDGSNGRSALKERQTFMDLSTGKQVSSRDKPDSSTWVRRNSLGGNDALPVFVQKENTAKDTGRSKPGRVGTAENLDERRTRRLSIPTQDRTASGIGPDFIAFQPRSESPRVESHASASAFVDIPGRSTSPSPHLPSVTSTSPRATSTTLLPDVGTATPNPHTDTSGKPK